MQSLNLPLSKNIQFMPLSALFEDSGPKFRHGGTERQCERACARTLALKPQNPAATTTTSHEPGEGEGEGLGGGSSDLFSVAT